MLPVVTLDEQVVDYIKRINKNINENEYWNPVRYEMFFDCLKTAMRYLEVSYKRATGTTLEDTSRRLFENVQEGGIETFINYYNAFLFIRKLEYKLRYHQNSGDFPK